MLTLLNLNVAGYIDPSVMTYAIQAIAGVIIAVGAFLGIYLRKAKKKLNNKLGIDDCYQRIKIINSFSGRRLYTASFS